MTDETKELNGQLAPVDEKKIEDKDPVASQEEDNQEIDYKAELERAKQEAEKRNKRLEQAEYKIVELKKKNKKEEDELEFDEFGEPIEKPKEDIRDIIKEELTSFKRDISSTTIDEEISKITSNSDEIALIKHHYENSINQSGFDKQSIQNDIQKAYTLANSQKILNIEKQ